MSPIQSLKGLTVLVTRPADQNQNLCNSLRELGAQPIAFPTIEIKAPDNLAETAHKIATLPTFDIAIFISANAVHHAHTFISQAHVVLNHVVIAAIGKQTLNALEKLGYLISVFPLEPYNSDALLHHQALRNIHNKKIAIIRGQGGLDHLSRELQKRGARPEYIEVYRRALATRPTAIGEGTLTKQLDLILASSSETVMNLRSLITDSEWEHIKHVPVVAGSKRIANTITKLGFSLCPQIADNPTDEEMIRIMVMWAQHHS